MEGRNDSGGGLSAGIYRIVRDLNIPTDEFLAQKIWCRLVRFGPFDYLWKAQHQASERAL